MAGRMDDKVAFITGAARGQGRSHAVRLAEEGADIIALDACAPIDSACYDMPTTDDLAQTVSLVEALDRRIVARQVDVRDFEALAQLVDDGVGELGCYEGVVVESHGSSVCLDSARATSSSSKSSSLTIASMRCAAYDSASSACSPWQHMGMSRASSISFAASACNLLDNARICSDVMWPPCARIPEGHRFASSAGRLTCLRTIGAICS